MRVLLTGKTGFIGSYLMAELLRFGYEVVIAKRNFGNLDWRQIGRIDALCHQAAVNDTTSTNRKEMFHVNVEASKDLFWDAVDHGCRHIVYASSIAVYGHTPSPQKESGPVNPLNYYAESKVALEEFANEFAVTNPDVIVIGLRYANVYGPGESRKDKMASMIYQLAQQIVVRNPSLFKDGEQCRDFIYVQDVVKANILGLLCSTESGVFNCGSGKATTFNELVKVLCTVLGKERHVNYIDNPFRSAYQHRIECDMTLAKARLGFVPKFSIETGIKAYHLSGFLV